MTTAAERLVALSGLGSSSALTHFAAITSGGAGPTAGEIAAAVLASLNATTIPVDVKKVNGVTIKGVGVPGDTWGPA